ncbi:MAG: NAD-dependent deacylase [Phycisphaeraceae bacterium]|nr:NAD-dependent deacylase [Phycisphaeraceae bacterium]
MAGGRGNPGGPALEAAAEALRRGRGVVVLTGAGVSAESRIPTFRDAMEGLWKSFDPLRLATPEAFAADPVTVSRWYDFRRKKCLEAQPNPGHWALADLERRVRASGGRFRLLTQNVDGLHQRAGSEDVVELHGSIMRWRCSVTGEPVSGLPEQFAEYPARTPDGHAIRPCVVWFGEALPERALEEAYEALETCDVFVSVGTSAVVYPAAGFVHLAAQRGATTIEVNREQTPISGSVSFSLRGSSGEMLPRLVESAFGAIDGR